MNCKCDTKIFNLFFFLKIEFKRDDAVNLPFNALIYRGVGGQGHYPLVVRIAKFIKKRNDNETSLEKHLKIMFNECGVPSIIMIGVTLIMFITDVLRYLKIYNLIKL